MGVVVMTRRSVSIDWTDARSIETIAKHPERATLAAVKEMAVRLMEQGIVTSFAHDLRPGLHVHEPEAANASTARMVDEWDVVSTAVHSRSRGWIPHVALKIKHHWIGARGEPDADDQTTTFMIPAETFETLVEAAHEVAQRSFLDAMTGPVER